MSPIRTEVTNSLFGKWLSNRAVMQSLEIVEDAAV